MREHKQPHAFQASLCERSIDIPLDPKVSCRKRISGALVAGSNGILWLNLPRPVAR
jgi:hypothetical protein